MITEKQYNLLCFVDDYKKSKGYCPSFEEIRKAIGLKSKCGVHSYVKSLVERGFMTIIPAKSRSLSVVKIPEIEKSPKDKLIEELTHKLNLATTCLERCANNLVADPSDMQEIIPYWNCDQWCLSDINQTLEELK